MLLYVPHSPSSHSFRLITPLTRSLPPSPLSSPVIRLKNNKLYTPQCHSSSRETAGKSAIQRISEKLRSLGYLPDDTAAASAGPPPTGPGSAGEIFIPTPYEIPKHRIGHTIDPSWSTPEHPVPKPGSGHTIIRFRELWKWEQDNSPPAGKEVNVPTVAELMLPRKELRRLRTLGIALTKRLKVGKAGITEGIVNGIHERWRRSEVVKIRCEDLCRMNMKRTHEILERKTGGLVVWRSGNIVVLYRGTNYKYPYFHSREGETKNVDEDCSDPTVDSIINKDLIIAENTSITPSFSRVHTSFVGGEDKMDNLNKELKIAANTSVESSGSRVRLPFVAGVDSPKKLRLQLPGETRLNEEADMLLDGLGPRFTDWWGEDPPPVDGDLLPAIVPGFRKSFRLLPFGLKPILTDRESTILRRLCRHIPCHFALGRNKSLQGLAVSIIKLWEKCEVAKIAIKRGAQNTNSEIMAEELKKLTGGTLLSRDKDFIAIYRGKDFLPPAVSIAIEERRNWNSCHRKPNNDDVAPFVTNLSSKARLTNSSSEIELKETAEEKRSLMVVRNDKSASTYMRKVNGKLSQPNQKIEKTEKQLAEPQENILTVIVESDKEGISEEERYRLTNSSSEIELKDITEGKRSLMVVRNDKSASTDMRKVNAKLSQANQRIEKTEKQLAELEKNILPIIVESDKEGISEEERYMLRRVGLKMKPFLLLGRRGVFDGTIENMHLHWKYRELVKIIFNDRYFENVESTARTLEAESGGILVAVERVSKGYAVVIYRGKNYQRPANLRPKTLLNKKEALKRSLEAQRYESLKLHALRLSNSIEHLDFKNASNDSTKTNPLLLAEFEGSSSEATDKILPFKIEDDNCFEPEIETNRSAESDFNGENFEASEVLSIKVSSGGAQSLSGSSSLESREQESDVESSFTPAPLSNRERLLLRKQALKMRKRPVLSVGRSNILTGVARTIKTHFKKHPLAIVNIKGRARGTSAQQLVFELEQATGSILVSREPNKIILYRGWGGGDVPGGMTKNDPSKVPAEFDQASVSRQLIEAIRRECGLQSGEA